MRLRESGEDYLEAILVLQQKHGAVRAIDIAGYLDVTKASVSKALSTLESKGLIEVVKRDVRLTEEGSQVAHEILERHVFFRDVLIAAGVDAETAAEEACHMEHCLSEDSFQKLKAHMGK
ncbi:metal-dependent transcriptional regulator [Collinsella tanakaei]|uniref:metal-dependent transcriptional regulator n=1 Tax=Collinsella tanakaei TaxID=626935 RepID=UPI0025A32B0D|nr:metal-dependent transcriptional regulator [Collinsella tanakaei]MDM8245395.1 metal-dependent transcriptional regulator [Collinsella tanakaei]